MKIPKAKYYFKKEILINLSKLLSHLIISILMFLASIKYFYIIILKISQEKKFQIIFD